MGGGGGSPLPSGAVRVEYLESNGRQRINTGVFFHAGDYPSFIIDCELLQLNTKYSSVPVGYYRPYGSSYDQASLLIPKSGGELWFTFGTTSDYDIYTGFSLNTRYRIIANTPTGNYVNWALIGTKYATVTHDSTQSVYLFVRNANGIVSSEVFIGRIYGCQIISNNEIVRDYIPVRIGQTGYMYDRVSGELFGNSGTGDFILGPDKN